MIELSQYKKKNMFLWYVRNIFGSHLRVLNKVNVGYVLRYTSPQSRVKRHIVENLYLKTCTRMHFYITIQYDNSI